MINLEDKVILTLDQLKACLQTIQLGNDTIDNMVLNVSKFCEDATVDEYTDNAYTIRAYNSESYTIWGKEVDAKEVCDYLNQDRETNMYGYSLHNDSRALDCITGVFEFDVF